MAHTCCLMHCGEEGCSQGQAIGLACAFSGRQFEIREETEFCWAVEAVKVKFSQQGR